MINIPRKTCFFKLKPEKITKKVEKLPFPFLTFPRIVILYLKMTRMIVIYTD